ncbi:SPW repeat-containing protein [Lentzea albidocapillata]|uniref:SPW repeat-containing protein n=1 Tax=Lentzea albidocapillata TaxID=40571 RepID=A0A1W2FS20_9PSEU|nr:SPW repeat-containing protein [Lentzea albidocapillata]
MPNALTFLAAVWLLLAAVSFDHTAAERWNELVTGTVIAVVALTRAISPRSIPWLDWVTVALGGWLVATPLLLAYDTPGEAVNVVVVGLVVIALALVSTAISWRARSKPRFDAYPGDTSRMG